MTARRNHREDSPSDEDRFSQSSRNRSETDEAHENSDIFLVAGLLFLHRLLFERTNGRVDPSLPFPKSGIHPATTDAAKKDHAESSTSPDDRLSHLCQCTSADLEDSNSVLTSRSETWHNLRPVRSIDRATPGDRSSKETLDSDREFETLAGIARDVLKASSVNVVGHTSNTWPKSNCEKVEDTVEQSNGRNESRYDCPENEFSGETKRDKEISMIDDSNVEAEVMSGESVESGERRQKNPVTLLLVAVPKTMVNLLSRKKDSRKSNETSKDDSQLKTPRSVQGKRKRLASVLLRLLRGKGSESNESISCKDSKWGSDTSQEHHEMRQHLCLQIERSCGDRLAKNRLAGSRTSKTHHHAGDDVSLREDLHKRGGLYSMLKPNSSLSKCNGCHLASATTGNPDEITTMQSIATVSEAKNRAANWITEIQEKVIPLRYSEASPRISIEQDLHVRTLLSSSTEAIDGSSKMSALQSDHRNPRNKSMGKGVRFSSKTKPSMEALVSQRWSKYDHDKFIGKSYSHYTNRADSTVSSTSFDTKDMLGLLVGLFLEGRVPRNTWQGLPQFIENTCSRTLNIEERHYAKLQANNVGGERSALDILLYHISTSTCTRCTLSPEKTRLIRSNKCTRRVSPRRSGAISICIMMPDGSRVVQIMIINVIIMICTANNGTPTVIKDKCV